MEVKISTSILEGTNFQTTALTNPKKLSKSQGKET
jgi:hypothetical protein